ncbi:MAG: ATP-binding protein [Actinobacteria bacterium]|nr:ATP-binding protein [Actinomycetota bacterium]
MTSRDAVPRAIGPDTASPDTAGPDTAGPDTATRLLQGLRELLDVVQQLPAAHGGPTLAAVLGEHLGTNAAELAVTREEVPGHRFVDIDIALAALADRDPQARVVGVGGGDRRYHHSLGDLVARSLFGSSGVPIGQVDYQNLAVGPDQERAVVAFGVRLFRYDDSPVAVLQRRASPRYGQNMGAVEVIAADPAVVAPLLDELRRLALDLSVVRGQIVGLTASGFEPSVEGLTFHERPDLTSADVILPEGTLDRVADHVIGVAERSAALRGYGQHLKRGVLLYGPPGTGKTHTVRYLLGATPRHTVVLLAGMSLRFVGFATQLARALQPAIVVLEDCDLVAEDRGMHPGAKPLLFEVLDAMDGLAADADVTFLLTTNRVEALERALSQRPGRVDLAVEIPLPDLDGRRRLLDLYAPPGAFSAAVVDDVARRTEGTPAAFAKELVRRSVLAATLTGAEPGDAHLAEATEQLLSDAEALSRRLLGTGADPGQGGAVAGWSGCAPGF